MSTEAEHAATVQRQKALSNAIQQEDTSQVLKMLRLGAVGAPDAVRLLLARGAAPTIHDTSGRNAFDYAQQPAEYESAEERKVEIRQMLSPLADRH